MKPGGYALVACLMLLGAGCVYSLQLRLDIYRTESALAEGLMRLPDARHLDVASLGYEVLSADILWLKAVQHMGERKITPEGYDWIYGALDVVTTLDPKFIQPYETGGLILTLSEDKVGLANRLLEKGHRNNPETWQLPFYIGFNQFYFQKDYKTAAAYISKAAAMEGSPSFLPLLASRLYVQADDPRYALEFLARIYESTADERVKRGIKRRMDLIKSGVVASEVQKLAELYREKTGRRARSLGELKAAGFLAYIPDDPAGGRFYLDAQGRVKSTANKEGVGVYVRGGEAAR